MEVIGTSLSEPHPSGKFGMVVMYTINRKKKQMVSLFGWYVCHVYKQLREKANNSLVQSYQAQKITS